MKIEPAVEALQDKIKRQAMYSPIPNNFFYEKIMYLNQWDNAMLDYILACTYFMGSDRMKYSASLIEKERKDGKLLGLPSFRKLQNECLDRLATLGLIRVQKRYKAATLVELTFFTFWIEEMTSLGFNLDSTATKIGEDTKNHLGSAATQTCESSYQDVLILVAVLSLT